MTPEQRAQHRERLIVDLRNLADMIEHTDDIDALVFGVLRTNGDINTMSFGSTMEVIGLARFTQLSAEQNATSSVSPASRGN